MGRVLTGKWKWNDVIKPMDADSIHLVYDVFFDKAFVSNGQSFKGIRFRHDGFWRLEYNTGSGFVEAGAGYHEDDYALPFEKYRVIDFGTGSEADDDADGAIVNNWFIPNITRYGTVAENLVQIVKNEKAVYQSGYNKALEKGGYNEGFEDGREKEWSDFWDAYQQKGNRTEYHNSFGMGWTPELFRPKYDIVIKGGFSAFNNFCYGIAVNLKQILADCNVTLTFPNCYNFGNCFSSSGITELGEIDLSTAKRTTATNVFGECTLLKTIDKLVLPVGQMFGTWFNNCKALENITIEGEIGNDINFQWSTKLTRASIESVINHLSDTASGKTLTLSKTAVDREFEDDMRPNAGSDSHDWEYLTTWKQNWQFVLV